MFRDNWIDIGDSATEITDQDVELDLEDED